MITFIRDYLAENILEGPALPVYHEMLFDKKFFIRV